MTTSQKEFTKEKRQQSSKLLNEDHKGKKDQTIDEQTAENVPSTLNINTDESNAQR